MSAPSKPRWRVLLLHAVSRGNATFSYQRAWPRHFAAHPRFEVTALDVADRRFADRVRSAVAVRRWRGDAIVLLHSVFSNTQMLAGHLLDAIAARREPKAFFVGNEYKLMPEKIAFAREVGVDLFVSQSGAPEVHALYRRALGCAVAGIPNTGLDPGLFRPTRPADERPIDLGYRSEPSPPYLGHTEREDIAGWFRAHAARHGLTVDISLDPRDRFEEAAWADFLNRCRGQLGTEAGGDYFELTDRTRLAVNAFQAEHPDAGFAVIHARFFAGYRDGVPLRIMSGRNVEAAGTRTVQLLLEGRYDGYFRADEHYIPLKKDFSNADDALRKFADRAYASAIAERAYALVTRELTYDMLIDRFERALAGVASPHVVS